eukprot:COSAG06_NODE_13128_length_1289_cov_9.574928_1_plen_87_part_00
MLVAERLSLERAVVAASKARAAAAAAAAAVVPTAPSSAAGRAGAAGAGGAASGGSSADGTMEKQLAQIMEHYESQVNAIRTQVSAT